MRRAAILVLAVLPAFCGDPAPPCTVPFRRIPANGNLSPGKPTHRVDPVFPAFVKEAGITGVVHLEAVIAKDGSIQSLRAFPPSHIFLVPTVIEAVRQWKYKPTLLNCEPVELETSITVYYTPADGIGYR